MWREFSASTEFDKSSKARAAWFAYVAFFLGIHVP
jgi:hypothetical protein